MDNLLDLISRSIACGADSPALARWLDGDAPDADRQQRARVLREQGHASRCAQWLQTHGWQLLTRQHPRWPLLLDTLDDAPGVLYVRGNLALPCTAMVAMVGARRASQDGLDHAHRFALELASAGVTVCSGLAGGIDGAAHRGALPSGRTVAVLAHGPDHLYPARHRPLAEAMVRAGGTLVTEFPPGLGPRKFHFPQRNRLISGLSLATLVIEAGLPSGSLVTAKLAADQGREVFAMPGAIHNPCTAGCHALLQDGANWLLDSAEVLAVLGLAAPDDCGPAAPAAPPPGLLDHFHGGCNDTDGLQQRSGLTREALQQQLTLLELDGWIERQWGGYRRLLR